MINIIWAVFWFLALGVCFGLILAYASKVFAVETDERVELLVEVLPGANCGGCGYAGCAALAEAIAKGEAKVNACPAGGTDTAEKISDIMGVNTEQGVRYRAQVMCSGTNDYAKEKYEYVGIEDCISAHRLAGGSKACPNGCLGLGTCVRHCKFNAIKIINGVAAVDYEKCKACGMCVESCPKKIIKLIPFESAHWVGCVSVDKGAATRKYCDIGCVGCKLCEKKCPQNAITVNDFVASVDYEKCTNCGICVASCPRKVIWSGNEQKASGMTRTPETPVNDTAEK